jgi:hypothetical protein
MELNSFFNDFLAEIRPTEKQIDDYKNGHTTLRKRLWAYPGLSEILVATFIQGSYRRSTAIRPQGDKRADVDVVAVTRLSRDEYTPKEAMDAFVPFLDKYYPGKYKANARSFAIELSYVDLDLVITSAPSESQIKILKESAILSELTPQDYYELRFQGQSKDLDEASIFTGLYWEKAAAEPGWKTEPLYIPDREQKIWERTHPLAQIEWAWGKNRATNGYYVNVVKAIKWWRRILHPESKYPKGYPLEHIIGHCCPDGIDSVAAGVVLALEKISTEFKFEAENQRTPRLPDHGVPEHNVFARVSGVDFSVFYNQVRDAAVIARKAYDSEDVEESASEWRKLFGSKFPVPEPKSKESASIAVGGFSPRNNVTEISGGRFG